MPKVSVITGFYNRGALLERTISSILEQTYSDFELIVFDDKSSDDTAERLRDLADRYADPRLSFVVHEENLGFVRGLTQAIERSQGEYIAIQGSGDASLPRRLELQVALLDERPEVGVVGGWYYNVQEGLGTQRLRRPNADDLTLDDLLKGNVFSHGEVMIRRSVLEAAGGYRTEFVNAQDYDLWLRARKIAAFATVSEPIYDRYVQFDGVSYVPQKVVTQACYSMSARRMARMSEADEARALGILRTEGPTALVPPDDPEVQSKLVSAVFRLTIFGSPAAGEQLARTAITGRLKRGVLVAFARVYGWPLSRPLRPLVARALGITHRPAGEVVDAPGA
jgi:hypothetical protein